MFARLSPAFAWSHAIARRPAAVAVPALKRAVQMVTTRGELAEMDDRMLRDIGLTRYDARIEVARAPWDLAGSGVYHRRRPPHRRGAAAEKLAEAWRRWRTRRALGELDDRMLKDIGASWHEARAEAAKPFWQG